MATEVQLLGRMHEVPPSQDMGRAVRCCGQAGPLKVVSGFLYQSYMLLAKKKNHHQQRGARRTRRPRRRRPAPATAAARSPAPARRPPPAASPAAARAAAAPAAPRARPSARHLQHPRFCRSIHTHERCVCAPSQHLNPLCTSSAASRASARVCIEQARRQATLCRPCLGAVGTPKGQNRRVPTRRCASTCAAAATRQTGQHARAPRRCQGRVRVGWAARRARLVRGQQPIAHEHLLRLVERGAVVPAGLLVVQRRRAQPVAHVLRRRPPPPAASAPAVQVRSLLYKPGGEGRGARGTARAAQRRPVCAFWRPMQRAVQWCVGHPPATGMLRAAEP